jgi:hypothetical protein
LRLLKLISCDKIGAPWLRNLKTLGPNLHLENLPTFFKVSDLRPKLLLTRKNQPTPVPALAFDSMRDRNFVSSTVLPMGDKHCMLDSLVVYEIMYFWKQQEGSALMLASYMKKS